MHEYGLIDGGVLDSYAQYGSQLGEHPTLQCVPGVEVTSGSLGHGLPMGGGIALAAKIQGMAYKTFVVMSDGECNEGSVWEAAMWAPAHGLDSLVAIVDYNHWQATGRSDEVTALFPLREKWEAFGWRALSVDGHNLHELCDALDQAGDGSGKPLAIIADTVKGKGVSFMEDDNNWHYRIPSGDELVRALEELKLT